MRRLPIFFLVDVSESMVGDSLDQLEEAFRSIISTLRQDPYALETAHVSVIAFAGKTRTLLPLTELISFYPPELPVGGGTALGQALTHLMNEIDRQVVTTTVEAKGDWKPTIFLITDGHPTDDTGAAVTRWNTSYRDRANLVAVSVGGQADHSVLTAISEDVIVFYDAAPDAFARFATWITMSIQTQSRSVRAGKDERVSLSKAEPDLLTPIDDAPGLADGGTVDPRFAVFVGRCEKNKMPYVVKYERHHNDIYVDDPIVARLLAQRPYMFKMVVPVRNSYFEFSEDAASVATVSSSELIGGPDCPYCGAEFGLAVCACGKVHCVDVDGEHVCPWCSNIVLYGSSEGESFEIGRALG